MAGVGRQLPRLTADGCVPVQKNMREDTHIYTTAFSTDVRGGATRDAHTAANGPASGIMAPPRGQADMVSTVRDHARVVVHDF